MLRMKPAIASKRWIQLKFSRVTNVLSSHLLTSAGTQRLFGDRLNTSWRRTVLYATAQNLFVADIRSHQSSRWLRFLSSFSDALSPTYFNFYH